ncbi:TPA: alpha/beta hydrolase, partial [Clostridioides difficile]|nr:alpha/beta hydrolase [Clostridioides difficile]
KFYEWCQGKDWENVVNLDTKALLQCANEKRPLFHKELCKLEMPILFTGSKEDEMCRHNLEEEYKQMATFISKASIHIFSQGGHPAILTNADEFAQLAKVFFNY